MRAFALGPASFLVFASACASSPPAVHVELGDASFATTGGNLFNCGSPAQPATPRALATSIDCEPLLVADGTYATTPVTVTRQMGCGDGNGALVTVVCQGSGNGKNVSGSVTISVASSCSTDSKTTAQDGASPMTFAFQDVAPGAVQTSPALDSCASFSSFCPSSNDCAFNSFAATLSVTNTAVVR